MNIYPKFSSNWSSGVEVAFNVNAMMVRGVKK
jgi:hypothetical protein